MEELLVQLILDWNYFGVFLAGLFSTVLPVPFPSPTFVLAIFAGRLLDPLFVGLAGGLGAALGETVGFFTGAAGKRFLLRKYASSIRRLEKQFERWRGELVVFAFAATPPPFDVVGIFCGAVGFPFRKFFLANLLGKIVKYLLLAYGGFYGLEFASSFFFE